MLDPFDDYPIHQTPVSISQNQMGGNAYDRYFFNGYAEDGSAFFAVAFGIYPNKRIVDAACCVVIDGVHHSVFASGRLGGDRRTTVGPITIEIVEPMQSLRVVVDHDEVGLDAVFGARTPPIEEPRFVNHEMALGVFDYTRYTQFGEWRGTASVAGESLTVDGFLGCRDRSWGQRGGRGADAAPSMPQFFWLWTPINFDNGALHLDANEYGDGARWHDGGFVAPLLERTPEPWLQPVETMQTIDHRLRLRPGTRWVEHAELTFTPWRDDPFTVELRPLSRFQMTAIGYGHPRFRHGTWVGESVVETERFVTDDVDPAAPTSFHVQQLVEAHRDGEHGAERGIGVLELLIIGPYRDLGLAELTDVAPG